MNTEAIVRNQIKRFAERIENLIIEYKKHRGLKINRTLFYSNT